MNTERLRRFFGRKKEVHPDEEKKFVNLENEIEQCLSYFELVRKDAYVRVTHSGGGESGTPDSYSALTILEKEEVDKKIPRLMSVHIEKYTVGRMEEGYFWQGSDNIPHAIRGEVIPQSNLEDIISEIQNASIPYAVYLKEKHEEKKHS